MLNKNKKRKDQINTLKDCQQKNIAPLSLYEFARIAQTESANILSDEEKLRFKNIVKELKQALEDLDDATKFENLREELNKFYEDIPIAVDLARAENAASVIEDEAPSDAKQIRKQAKILADLHMQQNNALTKAYEKFFMNLLIQIYHGMICQVDVLIGMFAFDLSSL